MNALSVVYTTTSLSVAREITLVRFFLGFSLLIYLVLYFNSTKPINFQRSSKLFLTRIRSLVLTDPARRLSFVSRPAQYVYPYKSLSSSSSSESSAAFKSASRRSLLSLVMSLTSNLQSGHVELTLSQGAIQSKSNIWSLACFILQGNLTTSGYLSSWNTLVQIGQSSVGASVFTSTLSKVSKKSGETPLDSDCWSKD